MSNIKRSDTHKPCCHCKEVKPLAEFYSTKRGNNGTWYSGRCRPCHLAHCKALRDCPNGKEVYRVWTQSESGKVSVKKRMEKWAAANKQKNIAHYTVCNAIRDNRLKRQPCRVCGKPNGEAHHISYDDPYNLDWLCKTCHFDAHYPQRVTNVPDIQGHNG
jgi:hypothetical protein